MPVAIPIEPRVGQILFGVALAAIGLWLLLEWLPAHRPMQVGETVLFLWDGVRHGIDRSDHLVLRPGAYPIARILAGLVALAGLEQVIRGALHRTRKEVTCRTCNARVVAFKTWSGGLLCPLGGHSAKRGRPRLLLTVLLLAVLGFVALAAIAAATSSPVA
ncbi:MAG: hypothetical protein ACTHU0_07715 [Kofleriaceae bacterium]